MGGSLYPLPAGFKPRQGKVKRKARAAGAKKPPPFQREGMEQRLLVRWAELAAGRHPELKRLYHIPNGGTRGELEAKLLKAEGVKKGLPDLHLPISRGVYRGLRIELKASGSVPSDMTPEQKDWLQHFQQEGEFAVGVNGWELARDLIQTYLLLNAGCVVPSGRYSLPMPLWIAAISPDAPKHAHRAVPHSLAREGRDPSP